MTSHRITIALAGLFALGIVTLTPPASAAQRVSSEPARTTKAVATPRWRADGFPSRLVSRMQYQELSAARILQVERYNATRQAKPTQIGVSRSAAAEGAGNRALPGLSWITLADGSSVARLEIFSPIALGLRVGLKVGMLDPRAELRFAGSSDPSRIVAVMSGKEILGLTDRNGIFWTPSTDGEKQSVEIYLPAGVPYIGTRLRAPQLSHLLTNSRNDFKIIEKVGESGTCNVDTVCRVAELGSNFVSAKNAVARMVFTEGGSSYFCTGTLLADTVTTSQIPYFYSANHCISNQTVASTLNTFWKYEATGCGNGTLGAYTQLAGGATFLYSDPDTNNDVANANATDALLLRLNNTPPAGSEFAGWDSATLAASSNIIGIHHPQGDLKKVSSGQKVSIKAYQNLVGWLSGTTEGGSSGSGLFTADATGYHLRGGLYGGGASCDNTGSLTNANNRDYYSRFDVVFPNIRQWLAPISATPIRVNGSQPLIPSHAGAASAASAASSPDGKRLVPQRRTVGPFER